MKMIKAVIRPEKSSEVLMELANAGFLATTKISILGRGKQQGLKMGDVYYDEIPKSMIVIVVEDENCETVVNLIMKVARTGKDGSYGDGKIFILPVERAYTISSQTSEL